MHNAALIKKKKLGILKNHYYMCTYCVMYVQSECALHVHNLMGKNDTRVTRVVSFGNTAPVVLSTILQNLF